MAWKPNPENDIAGYRLQWSADGEPLREVETAAIFQPITGPRRFWWAEIETP